MSRILGIDYGEKRIGLALTDEEKNMAFPLETVENNWPRFKEKLEELIETKNISQIVLGLPVSLKGHETKSTEMARKFARKIEREFKLPVIFENEILSTAQVLKQKSAPREKIDASAAALILGNYLKRVDANG